MKRVFATFLCAFFFVASTAFAQETTPPPAPTPSTEPTEQQPPPPPPPPPPPSQPGPLRFQPTPEAAPPVVGSATPPPEAKTMIETKEKDLEVKKFKPYLRLGGGFQYAQAETIPIIGARGRVGIGWANQKIAHYAMVSVLYGATQNSLRTWDVRVSWMTDVFHYGIFRGGFDAEIGHLFIRRASVDDRLWSTGVGGGIHGSFDIVPLDPSGDSAVLLEPRIEMHYHFGGVFMWGPSILIGIRY